MRSLLSALIAIGLISIISAADQDAAQAQSLFKTGDKNGDNKWDFCEFMQRDPNLIKFEQDRFAEQDSNRDGFVTLNELTAYLKKKANEKPKPAAPKPATSK